MDDLDNGVENITAEDNRLLQLTEKMEAQTCDRKFLPVKIAFHKNKCERLQAFNRRQRDDVNGTKVAPRHQKGSKDKCNQRSDRDKQIRDLQGKVAKLSNLLEIETGKKKSVLSGLQKEQDRSKQLCDDLQKYKDLLKLEKNSEVKSVQASANVDIEAKISSLIKERELLTIKLQNEQTMRQQLEDELQECKDVNQIKPEASGPNILTKFHCRTSRYSSGDMIELQHIGLSQRPWEELKTQILELSTRLDTEIKKNNSLSKENESLTAELQKCREALFQKHETPESSAFTDKMKFLEKEKKDLYNNVKIEQEVNKALQREAESLFTKLQTEEKKSNDLERWIKSESAKLQKERRQRLELDVQLDKQAVTHKRELDALKESRAEIKTLHKDIESLKGTVLELSSKLELEEELSKSLNILNERLSINLEKEKEAHQQELEVFNRKLESLKVANSEILGQLHTEKEADRKKSQHFFGRRKKNKERQKEEESTTTSTSTPSSQRVSKCYS